MSTSDTYQSCQHNCRQADAPPLRHTRSVAITSTQYPSSSSKLACLSNGSFKCTLLLSEKLQKMREQKKKKDCCCVYLCRNNCPRVCALFKVKVAESRWRFNRRKQLKQSAGDLLRPVHTSNARSNWKKTWLNWSVVGRPLQLQLLTAKTWKMEQSDIYGAVTELWELLFALLIVFTTFLHCQAKNK